MNKVLIITSLLISLFSNLAMSQVIEISIENNQNWLNTIELSNANFHKKQILFQEAKDRITLLEKELDAYEFKYNTDLAEHLRFQIKTHNTNSLNFASKLNQAINEINSHNTESSISTLSELVIYGPKLFDALEQSTLSDQLEDKRVEIQESLFVISQGKKSLNILKGMNSQQRVLYLHHLQTQLDLLIIDLSKEQEEVIKKWSSRPGQLGKVSRLEQKALIEEASEKQLKNLAELVSKLEK